MTIPDARAVVGKSLGWYFFDGSDSAYSGLSKDDQVKLSDGLMAYIYANQGAFSSGQVALATKAMNAKGFGSALADENYDPAVFGDEMLNQAVAINDAFNPLAEKNRAAAAKVLKSSYTSILYVALGGAVLYFVGPILLASFFKGRAAKAAPTP